MRIAVFFLVLAIFCHAHGSWADEYTLKPSVAVRQAYNDNIFFSSGDIRGDFLTTFSPGIEFAARNERYEAGVAARMDGIIYADTQGLNSVDQDYRGRFRLALSPVTTLSTQASFTLDSQPDRDVEATGLVTAAVKRRRQCYSVAGDRVLSEKTSLSLSYSYEQDDYDAAPGFTDIHWHSAGLTLFRSLDGLYRTARGNFEFNYTGYGFSGSDVDNFSASLGLDLSVNELWSIQASAGGRYTVSEFQTFHFVAVPPFIFAVPATETSRSWGWVGQLAVAYKGETTSGNVAFNSDVMPASGQTSGTSVRTAVVGETRKRFTYELSGALSAGYYLNKSNPGATAGRQLDDTTIMVSPSLRYEFNRDMFVETSYQYTRVNNGISHTSADRNLFFVRFSMQHPFFL